MIIFLKFKGHASSNSHNRPDDSEKRKLSMNHVSAICFKKCHHYLLEIIEDIHKYIECHIETISDETVCC